MKPSNKNQLIKEQRALERKLAKLEKETKKLLKAYTALQRKFDKYPPA